MNKFLACLIMALLVGIIDSAYANKFPDFWPQTNLIQQLLYLATGAMVAIIGKPKRILKIRIKYQDGTSEEFGVTTTLRQLEIRGAKTSKVVEFTTLHETKMYQLPGRWFLIKRRIIN